MLECLDNIIGLAEEACACDGEAPQGYNTSMSGHYLIDEEYGVPARFSAQALADCTENSLWAALAKARARAVRDVQEDIRAHLAQSKSRPFYAWSGVVGETSTNRRGTSGRALSGVVLYPQQRAIDTAFVVTAIWAGFNATGTVDVTVSGNGQAFTPQTVTLGTVAGRFERNILQSPMYLPMYDAAQPGLAYALSYPAQGVEVLVNRRHCNCGGRPGWEKHLKVSGFQSDTAIAQPGGHYEPSRCNEDLRGLALEGYFSCDDLGFLCRLGQLGEANLYSLLGRAVSYKAAIRFFRRAESSAAINQAVLVNAEQRAARISAYGKEYNNILDYIVQNVPTGASACWGCSKGAHRAVTIQI
jgi:hypothetical protein